MTLLPSFRNEVLRTLHSAHQGMSSMEPRARSIIFWPGISTDIHETRDRCSSFNKTAPSQSATPPAALDTPWTSFESVFADFCYSGGCHYFVVDDRLSGWVDIYKTLPTHHTPEKLASLLVFVRCSPISAYLKSCLVMGALNSQLPKPPTSYRDGGGRHRISSIAFPHFRSLTAGPK